MTTIYGIKNCSTVKKALGFLESNKVEYTFHDYKKLGIDAVNLEKWCNQFGWQKVLNRSGMMWKKASEETKSKVINQATAIEFMLMTPTSIKRPIIQTDKASLLIGFQIDQYQDWLDNNN